MTHAEQMQADREADAARHLDFTRQPGTGPGQTVLVGRRPDPTGPK